MQPHNACEQKVYLEQKEKPEPPATSKNML